MTRLIDRHGAGKALPELRDMLAADCPRRSGTSFFNECGAHFRGCADGCGKEGLGLNAISVYDLLMTEANGHHQLGREEPPYVAFLKALQRLAVHVFGGPSLSAFATILAFRS